MQTARRYGPAAGILLLVILAIPGCGSSGDSTSGGQNGQSQNAILPAPESISPGDPIDPFALTDQTGEVFVSSSLAGKVWIGSIFFSSCPGPCFRENQALADILSEIEDPDLMVVSITCDPENDKPNVLDHYSKRFEADPDRWKFLTGDMDEIKRIANETFFLPAEVGVHSERGVIFDRQGRMRGSFHLLQPDRVAVMKKTIRDVLADEGTAEAASAQGSGQEEPQQ
jgi:cytochrome oxidase Cu insertion factor (SCO1/SenC/PrrC family)